MPLNLYWIVNSLLGRILTTNSSAWNINCEAINRYGVAQEKDKEIHEAKQIVSFKNK